MVQKNIKPNRELSDAAYVNHGKSGQKLEFPRFQKEMGVKKLGVSINFSWGSNKQFPSQIKEYWEIDKEVGRVLLQKDLFHLRDNVVIKLLPASEKKKEGSYSSYESSVELFVR